MAVEDGYIYYPYQVIVIIPSPVCIGAVGLDDPVPAFPDADCTCPDAGQLLQFGYGITIHVLKCSGVKIIFCIDFTMIFYTKKSGALKAHRS
jgi:hypothetical protein